MNHQEPTNQNITPLFQEGNEMNARELTTEANPLFDVIQIKDRNYISSKLFFRDYTNDKGKNYSSVTNFNKMIRKMPLFDALKEGGSIIEVLNDGTRSELEHVRKANRYNPVLLLDPTAQRTVEFFLENESSKDAALRTSALGAAVETGDEHAKQIAAKGYGKLSALNGGLQHLTEFLTEQSERIVQLEQKTNATDKLLEDCFLSSSQLLEVDNAIKRLAKKE